MKTWIPELYQHDTTDNSTFPRNLSLGFFWRYCFICEIKYKLKRINCTEVTTSQKEWVLLFDDESLQYLYLLGFSLIKSTGRKVPSLYPFQRKGYLLNWEKWTWSGPFTDLCLRLLTLWPDIINYKYQKIFTWRERPKIISYKQKRSYLSGSSTRT